MIQSLESEITAEGSSQISNLSISWGPGGTLESYGCGPASSVCIQLYPTTFELS